MQVQERLKHLVHYPDLLMFEGISPTRSHHTFFVTCRGLQLQVQKRSAQPQGATARVQAHKQLYTQMPRPTWL